MKQEIIDLFDEYTHTSMPRRAFFQKLTVLAGSTVAATALLPILQNSYAKAAIVSEDDPQLSTESITYPGAGGECELSCLLTELCCNIASM